MTKKIIIDLKGKVQNPNFVREKRDPHKIYILDEIEYLKLKKIEFDDGIVNINCQVLEYDEEVLHLRYRLKNPTMFISISKSLLETFAVT